VLLTRRDDGAYGHEDYATIATIADAVAVPFERLLRASTARP
jgi:hypothetical protein